MLVNVVIVLSSRAITIPEALEIVPLLVSVVIVPLRETASPEVPLMLPVLVLVKVSIVAKKLRMPTAPETVPVLVNVVIVPPVLLAMP